MIVAHTADRRDAMTFYHACTRVMPSLRQPDFAIQPSHFFREIFKDEITVITATYAVDQLLGMGDAEGFLLCPPDLKALENRNNPVVRDIRHVWYTAYMAQRVDEVLNGITSHVGAGFKVTAADRMALLRIFRYKQQSARRQDQFDYLSTLTTAHRQEMDVFITRVAEHLAHQFRSQSTYPQSALGRKTFSHFFACQYPDFADGLVARVYLQVNGPRMAHMNGDLLACCGILQTCIENLLLSWEQYEWWDIFAHANATRHAAVAFQKARSHGVFEIVRSNTSPGRLIARPTPTNANPPATVPDDMDYFAKVNALWAWNQALALPQGQAFQTAGVPRPPVPTGFFVGHLHQDLRPDWPCLVGTACDGAHLD